MTTKKRFRVALYVILVSGLLLPSFGAQADPQAQAVKKFFSGHKVLISYREGSPLRGTYFHLQVHFCESGSYRSFGESRRQTGLNQEEVRHWSDQGTWAVHAESGRVGVRCLSSSGQASFVPVLSWPNRDGEKASQVVVVPQGAAQCN